MASKKLTCASCEQQLPVTAFSKNQASKKTGAKCKACVEGADAAPPAAAASVKAPVKPRQDAGAPPKGAPKGRKQGKISGKAPEPVESEEDSGAAPPRKGAAKGATKGAPKGAADQGGKKKKGGGGGSRGLECSQCGDMLAESAFSRNQLSKGDERRCKECVDFQTGGGGGAMPFGFDDGGDSEEDSDFMFDLPPHLQPLLAMCLECDGPEEAVMLLEQKRRKKQITKDEMMQVLAVMEDIMMGAMDDGEDFGEDEDEGEGEDGSAGDDPALAEDLRVLRLGPEALIVVADHFEAERKLLSGIAVLPRADRLQLIAKFFVMKKKRLQKLIPQYPMSASDLDPNLQVGFDFVIEEPTKAPADLGAAPADVLVARQLLELEEGVPSNRDLVAYLSKKTDDFAQALLYTRNRTFNGMAKEEPALVRLAREGNVAMVRALLQVGAAPGDCILFGETALTAAKAAGHAEVVALLEKVQ